MNDLGGRAECRILDNSLDFGPKQTVFGGVSVFSRLFWLRGTGVEGFEGKSYRSRRSTAEAPARMVLTHKEGGMIRMVADCASPRVIALRLKLEDIDLRADLNSVFRKLAIQGRLELLSPKGC